MANKTFAQDMATLIAGWNKIEAATRAQFPKASDEEIYQRTKSAMLHALGK